MMLSYNLSFITLVVLVTGDTVRCVCPDPILISPCVCKNEFNFDNIYCGGNSDIDLIQIFEKLETNLTKTDKHFNQFYLNNTAITELKDNTFRDITFDEIRIESCTNLTTIDKNAFTLTDLITKVLRIKYNTRLSSPDNSIYEVLTKFINIEDIYLYDNNISEIPSNAFKMSVGNQDKLSDLFINGKSITHIGNNAFSSLNSLTYLSIYDTSIEYLPEYVFAFEKESQTQIHIYLRYNSQLKYTHFPTDLLTHLRRPTYFDYWGTLSPNDDFEFLDVFKRFMDNNDKNQLDINNLSFDCNNCKNIELKKHPDYLKRVTNMKCSNGKNVNDQTNFADCGPDQKLKPCTFVEDERAIYCGGNIEINLKSILKNFSNELEDNGKHFKAFYLNNTSIKVLEENTFNDLSFDKIVIANCTNLEQIDENSFTATNLITKSFEVNGNPEVISYNQPKLFEMLSRFINIEKISLAHNGLTEIPSNAFQPLNGYQNHLTTLLFNGPFTNLGNNAFSNLKILTKIEFNSVKFVSIPDNAFAFEHASNQTLSIIFTNSTDITSNVFRENSLANINRPANIIFSNSSGHFNNEQVKYLDEKVFQPFLLSNDKNTIELWNSMFDCNDCRNYWLKKQPDLLTRVTHLGCSNLKKFTDPDNFKNCSEY